METFSSNIINVDFVNTQIVFVWKYVTHYRTRVHTGIDIVIYILYCAILLDENALFRSRAFIIYLNIRYR